MAIQLRASSATHSWTHDVTWRESWYGEQLFQKQQIYLGGISRAGMNLNLFLQLLKRFLPKLWFHGDVVDVLTENTGTSKIEGIMVKLPTADEIRLSTKCFKKMKNLKIFINVNARFCGKPDLTTWGKIQAFAKFEIHEIHLLRIPNKNPRHVWNPKLRVIYQLQKLKKVELHECPKLKTFPNKVNFGVLMPTTYSKVSHDNSDDEGWHHQLPEDREFNLALPLLREFDVRGCSDLSDSDFLASLDCASTLEELDLSGSNIVSLSECLCKFICLRQLYLGGCRNLVEIPQLPPHLKHLDAHDCVSLEKISNLSKILEREESQMIEAMDLSNCWRLIKELVQEANVLVNDDDYQTAEALFSLFLSSQQSKITITFPGCEVPAWFSCQMNFKGLHRFEFFIEILSNFKWENTGLALCVAVDPKLQSNSSRYWDFQVYIHINEVQVLRCTKTLVDSTGSAHLWLHYIPSLEMWRLGYMRPLPPFRCRVNIYHSFDSRAHFKSCGVHLVMPPNEDVCMKLSRVENLNIERPRDIYENYRPKKRTDCKIIYTDGQLEKR
ncbi:hypothetical protein M0R45_031175 [Rubus argutus]|uniref:Disease resistance protein RPS4B/Roq1-like leucine-rich repeats domain-containing protein n=1 Tax=Rubus argutus TaxID=59490 RepID=A0AAW1WDI2_RUBAR